MNVPRWYAVTWLAWLGLFGTVALAYYLGAGGIRAGGVRMAFDQDRPQQLYRIDATRAFLVERDQISVVHYARANPLLYPCGCYILDGAIANGVDRRHGAWVYTSSPGGPRFGADAVNVATGEVIAVAADRDTPAAKQALAARGFAFDRDEALDPAQIARTHDALWLRKESCMTWLLAFYALGLLLLALAPVAMWSVRRRAPRSPRR